MKKTILFLAASIIGILGANAQQLWDDFDGLPTPTIVNYTYADGGLGVINFAFTNPNSTGNSSSTCMQYSKPTGTYQKIYIKTVTGFQINDVSAFKSGSSSFSIKILNAAGTAISVQIGLNNSAKTSGAWPAGRHSTYTAITTTSTDWQTLVFAYDNGVGEDATVSNTEVDEIIIEVNGASASAGVYLLDDLTLANVSSTTSIFSKVNSNNLFKLNQNSPNPFKASTKISYQLNRASDVTLEILNPLGDVVKEFLKDDMPAGEFAIEFDANGMQNGVYYCRLKSGEFVETIKMIVND